MSLPNQAAPHDPLAPHNRRATIARHTKGNGAFSTKVPGLQVIWDSTSLGLLKTCPRKYFFSQVLGMNGRGENVHLIFGIVLHSSLEAYDHARAKGKSWREGVRAALTVALMNSGSRVPAVKGCVHCSIPDEVVKGKADECKIEPFAGESGWCWKCSVCGTITPGEGTPPTRWIPWQSTDKYKNRDNLVKAVVWYLGKFSDDPTKTVILDNGKPAVELSFKIDTGLPSLSGEHYVLSGHLDRLVTFGESVYVQDRKTTKYALDQKYFEKYSPDNQMTLYSLAGKMAFAKPIAGVMVDAMQTLTYAVRYRRRIISRTSAQLESWWRDFHILLGHNEQYVKLGHWPQNDTACSNYGGCQYLKVCAMDEDSHWNILSGEFAFRQWDPSVARGGE